MQLGSQCPWRTEPLTGDRTDLNSRYRRCMPINGGVLQGSVLYLTLFVLYINYMLHSLFDGNRQRIRHPFKYVDVHGRRCRLPSSEPSTCLPLYAIIKKVKSMIYLIRAGK